ncbi:hypothetical protein ABZ891_13125 [Streptomyces sp. NPDC047023]|uniref:hypothetical protein n=1 Tax=Streptomyces sp. NPDC047023 TaxID=3155139 RepID=UPI0033F053C5
MTLRPDDSPMETGPDAPLVVRPVDPSAEAAELVGWYRRRGYVQVGTWHWNVTNYKSVALSKALVAR